MRLAACGSRLDMYDFLVIGGGIVGLATARELLLRRPRARLAVLEKEPRLAVHQSGRNSGVIHSGVYYRPGSLKAELATRGNRAMIDYCRGRGLPVDVCGKLIVATEESELAGLMTLRERANGNGVPVEWLEWEGIREIEPHAAGIAAIRVASAAITNFAAVCESLARDVREGGGEILLGGWVEAIESGAASTRVRTSSATLEAAHVVACAGLQSDRIARLDGLDPGVRIIPFRGEYFELVPRRRHLVRALIYPVPDPAYPFLGVHLTRMIDGAVHAGPNAVLSFGRESYERRRLAPRDLASTLSWPGFWRMAARNMAEGWAETARSLSRRRFAASGRRLVPELRAEDLVRAAPGIRAQAVLPDGSLADDFLFLRHGRSLHVLNAPSPAATASLEIARHIADNLVC